MSNEYENNEEVSLKELILLIQSYIIELFKKWWLILIICGVSFALLFLNESLTSTSYTSKLTFMMNKDNNSSLGGVSGLLGTFGFGGGGDNNLDKMIKIIKSRSNMKEVLFFKYTIDGKEDFYANHILRSEDVEVFTDETETELFYFTDSEFGKRDRLENKALLKIYKFLVGGDEPGVVKVSYDETSGIINIESTFQSEDLAVEFPTALFNVVEKDFIKKAVAKNQNTYDIIESKHDSITTLISSKEYQLAAEMDSGRNLLLNKSKIQRLKLEKDLRILYEQYGEVIKIKEQAEFSLLNVTPAIQAIDLPIFPIKPNDMGIIKLILYSVILGLFFSVAIILGMKIYNDAMAE